MSQPDLPVLRNFAIGFVFCSLALAFGGAMGTVLQEWYNPHNVVQVRAEDEVEYFDECLSFQCECSLVIGFIFGLYMGFRSLFLPFSLPFFKFFLLFLLPAIAASLLFNFLALATGHDLLAYLMESLLLPVWGESVTQVLARRAKANAGAQSKGKEDFPPKGASLK